ncbi:hypothetical protein [Blastococcus brunescens]|uniref:Uncharacterized protein n=1 Tax=Blastococcus brunescens TaxID=1564165 RepID=A0ABZ1B0I3_9ACTN|nr:hypothetical protein [Blastococcus sp. BMG 8361]WRL64320.1 hypothetical protein U6N30_00155 [Blastococcus sp. BMG 8361]
MVAHDAAVIPARPGEPMSTDDAICAPATAATFAAAAARAGDRHEIHAAPLGVPDRRPVAPDGTGSSEKLPQSPIRPAQSPVAPAPAAPSPPVAAGCVSASVSSSGPGYGGGLDELAVLDDALIATQSRAWTRAVMQICRVPAGASSPGARPD